MKLPFPDSKKNLRLRRSFPAFTNGCQYGQLPRHHLGTVRQGHPRRNLFFAVWGKRSGYPGIILLIYMFFWRQQLMSQLSVIGKKQQALCINIKTAHRKQIPSDFPAKQIDYRFVNPILCCRDNPLRFIQHIVFIRMIGNRFSIQEHLIRLWIDFSIRLFFRLSVYLNSSLFCSLLI